MRTFIVFGLLVLLTVSSAHPPESNVESFEKFLLENRNANLRDVSEDATLTVVRIFNHSNFKYTS